VVCVWNDAAVREACLDASVEALRAEAPSTRYVPIDNSAHAFPSAGAALNHGARLAETDVVAFAHQDVRLHSLVALEQAAALLLDENERIGVLGACGIATDGRIVGTVRDRVVLIGERPEPVQDVDSLDEVLFMVSRHRLLADPLTEHADLAWHGYAVEYGLRVRRLGFRVAAADLPLTHNSLTVNLDRLDVAHARIGRLYPEALPVRTTCGAVARGTPADQARPRLLAAHRWRYRWLKATAPAHALRRAAGGGPVVFDDIRLDVDEVVAGLDEPLHVYNVDPEGVTGRAGDVFELPRRGRTVRFEAGDIEGLAARLAGRRSGEPVLATNMSTADLARVAPLVARSDRVIGFHEAMGCWMLVGCPTDRLPASWRSARATPLGMRALAG